MKTLSYLKELLNLEDELKLSFELAMKESTSCTDSVAIATKTVILNSCSVDYLEYLYSTFNGKYALINKIKANAERRNINEENLLKIEHMYYLNLHIQDLRERIKIVNDVLGRFPQVIFDEYYKERDEIAFNESVGKLNKIMKIKK
jgi:hypothetical protein